MTIYKISKHLYNCTIMNKISMILLGRRICVNILPWLCVLGTWARVRGSRARNRGTTGQISADLLPMSAVRSGTLGSQEAGDGILKMRPRVLVFWVEFFKFYIDVHLCFCALTFTFRESFKALLYSHI